MADDEKDNFREKAMAMYKASGKAATKRAAKGIKGTMQKGDSKKLEQDEYKRMAMEMYKADPHDMDADDRRAMLEKVASKTRARQKRFEAKEKEKEKERTVVVEVSDSDDDDDDSSSDSEVDEATKKRRAKDREIQARKAAELRKKKRGKLGGAQEKAKGMKDRFGRLKNKLTQGERPEDEDTDEDDAGEGADNSEFMKRRRKLLKNLEGGTKAGITYNEALGAKTDSEWEKQFIFQARRKKTCISICCFVFLIFCCSVTPLFFMVKANMCKEPGTEEKDTSIFSAANLELIHVKNFRGTVSITSDINATEIELEQAAKATSPNPLTGVKVRAELVNRQLIVTAEWKEKKGGAFSINSCPEAHLSIVVPNITGSWPVINITMHGPRAKPTLSPWVGVLVPDKGEITLKMDPAQLWKGVFLLNTIGGITVEGLSTAFLSATATQGNVTLANVRASQVRLTSQGGNVTTNNVQLLGTAEALPEFLEPRAKETLWRVSEERQLGYGALGRMSATSLDGNVDVHNTTNGSISVLSGSGNVDLWVSSLGFSGTYDLQAPYGDSVFRYTRLRDLPDFGGFTPQLLRVLYPNSTVGLDALVEPDFVPLPQGAYAFTQPEIDRNKLLDDQLVFNMFGQPWVLNRSYGSRHVGRVFDNNGGVGAQHLEVRTLGGNMTVNLVEEVSNMTHIMSKLTNAG